MSAPNGIHRALWLALSVWLGSGGAGAASGCEGARRGVASEAVGLEASVVVREVLSDYRQTGPQTVVILTTTGYREAEIGLAGQRSPRRCRYDGFADGGL
jgi:hypothetical protein